MALITRTIDQIGEAAEPMDEDEFVIGGAGGIAKRVSYSALKAALAAEGVRAISLQYRCGDNLVANNLILENSSSAVHLAYSCDNNQIAGNVCKSTRCDSISEGLFQAYVGCTGNVFSGNIGTVTGSAGPGYYGYTAIHSSDNNFVGNTFTGPAQKAAFGADSSWDSTAAKAGHYGAGLDPLVNGFANTGMADIEFSQNVVRLTNAVPVFFLGQVSDPGSRALQRVSIMGNTIKGTAYSRLLDFMEETDGNLVDIAFAGNVHAALPAKFDLPRGRGHFRLLADKVFDGDGSETPFPDGATIPNVAFGREFKTANTAATGIIYFGGGISGQQIEVRIDANTTLVASADMVLKGNVNAVGVANGMMTFRRKGGSWVELSRTF